MDWDNNWRGLYFGDYEDIEFDLYFDEIENDIDAMYVAGFLEAIGSLQLPPTNLETIVAKVKGPAFWSLLRLAWLLEDVGHRRIRQLRDKVDAIIADEDAASQLSKLQTDDYSARWSIL
ncbi:hypothetical protein PMIN07_011674 [Paraphaeosphaeria minitans]